MSWCCVASPQSKSQISSVRRSAYERDVARERGGTARRAQESELHAAEVTVGVLADLIAAGDALGGARVEQGPLAPPGLGLGGGRGVRRGSGAGASAARFRSLRRGRHAIHELGLLALGSGAARARARRGARHLELDERRLVHGAAASPRRVARAGGRPTLNFLLRTLTAFARASASASSRRDRDDAPRRGRAAAGIAGGGCRGTRRATAQRARRRDANRRHDARRRGCPRRASRRRGERRRSSRRHRRAVHASDRPPRPRCVCERRRECARGARWRRGTGDVRPNYGNPNDPTDRFVGSENPSEGETLRLQSKRARQSTTRSGPALTPSRILARAPRTLAFSGRPTSSKGALPTHHRVRPSRRTNAARPEATNASMNASTRASPRATNPPRGRARPPWRNSPTPCF